MSDIPFQVEQLINNCVSTKENIHIRGNYRARLAIIKEACEKAMARYDSELFRQNTTQQQPKKKA